MSSLVTNEHYENHPKSFMHHKKRHEHSQPQSIVYTNKALFDQKISNFIESYRQNKKSVAIVTDFDYTLTSRIDYKTGKLYSSSYYLYDEDIIGGNQLSFDERRKALCRAGNGLAAGGGAASPRAGLRTAHAPQGTGGAHDPLCSATLVVIFSACPGSCRTPR